MQSYTILNYNQKKYLFYFHGGGYLMGDKNDLPHQLIDFLKDNFNVILFNYPLAPHTKFESIIESTHQLINEVISRFEIEEFILFGRSSGSNLIFSLDVTQLKQAPKAIFNFYGYPSLDLNWTSQPIRNINLIQPYHFSTSESFTLTRDPKRYYPHYIYARQTGNWPKIIDISEKPITYNSLTPVFTAHSIFDPDVPYKVSLILNAYFKHHTRFTSKLHKHAIDHDSDELQKILVELNRFIINWRLHE